MEQAEKIADKRGVLVPLLFNAAQLRLADVVSFAMHEGRPIRILLPKGRQMGISRWIVGFIVANAELSAAVNVAFQGAVVAHHDKTGDELMEVARTMVREAPSEYRRLAPTARDAIGLLRWKAGAAFTSGTIRTGDALLKGFTVNMLHFTEAGNYADRGIDAPAALAAALGAMAKGAKDELSRTAVFIESTAKGKDPFFYAMIDDSLNRRSDYQVVFLPWFIDPTYRMSWADFRKSVLSNPLNLDPGPAFVPTQEEDLLRARLRYPVPEEQWTFRYQTELPDEALVWRRWVTRNDYSNNPAVFSQYYPSTVEEAFVTTEHCAFSIDDISYYSANAKPPKDTGLVRVEGNRTFWAAGSSVAPGLVSVWQHPRPDADYLLAADPARSQGEDYCAAYVVEKVRFEVVAAIHAHLDWEFFAELLHATALYYNQALVVVEHNACPAIPEWFHKQAYRNLYYYQSLYRLNVSKPSSPGFNMNRSTRPAAIDALAATVRSRILKCPDEGLAREMKDFAWNANKFGGRFEARGGGFDDRIMALAMAAYILRPAKREDVEAEAAVVEDDAYASMLRWRDHVRAKRRRGGAGMML